MKKLLLILFSLIMIASPTDLKLDINVFEDEEIYNKYGHLLKEVDEKDFETNIGKNSIFLSSINLDNNVINSQINDEFKFLDYNFKNNFTFNIKKLELLLKKNISPSMSKSINENIKDTDVSKFFTKGNRNLEKFNKFKRDLIDFSNSKILKVGILKKGKFLNKEVNNEVYNNVIEIDLD